jgi:hypothetical protein
MRASAQEAFTRKEAQSGSQPDRCAAYASQFLDPIGRAWRTMSKVKARLIGNEDPDEWDLICGVCLAGRYLGTIVVAARPLKSLS